MNVLIESLDAQSDEDLLIVLGRDMAAEEAGRRLKSEDLRHFLSLGKRWFAELKLEFRDAVCSSEQVRRAVTEERLSNRIVIIAAVATCVSGIEERGAIAFSILLLREGLQTYCESVWRTPGL